MGADAERLSTAEYTIRRSPRARRITVKVDPCAGAVEVVLPQRAHTADAERAVRELAPWIARRQAKAARARAAIAARPPGTVPYLGRELALVTEPARTRVHRIGDTLLVPRDRAALERWYRRRAQSELAPRVEGAVKELAGRERVAYARTVIRDQRTRWGSCSARGTISLNWRLLLAPDEVAEYVVVHEACHLVEMNHSPVFWALVAELYPGFESPRRWLRSHGATLNL